MIIINFKNYKIGKEALVLAKKIEKYLPNSIVAVSTLDLENIAQKTKLNVFAQHIDSQEGNRATGFMNSEKLKIAGGKGGLLNHSEHRISFNIIKKILKNSKNLKIILCSSSLNEVRKFIRLKPYAIAFEDPKLVGSGKSITEYRSKDVKKFAKIMKKTKIIPLCGAGISSANDVKESYDLGCKGVLIASAIANSKRPNKLLREIAKLKR